MTKASEVLRHATHKQIYYSLKDNENGYCALGALACEAGLPIDPGQSMLSDSELFKLALLYDVLARIKDIRCPKCDLTVYYMTPLTFIPHLNDKHKMTFEEIADWLTQFENSQ